MTATVPLIFDLPASPLRFEYLPTPLVALLFLLLALPVIRLGLPMLKWQGTTRGWTSIAVRLAAVWVLVMLLAGARWERRSHEVEVVVLRDVSESVAAVPHPAGKSIPDLTDDFLRDAAAKKKCDDRIGVVSFDDRALIDALPDTKLHLDARAVRDERGRGTDLSAGIHTGLASFRGDAMRRLVLVSDGNETQGDLDPALAAAKSAGVPIDVLPLSYQIDDEVLIDKLVAPAARHENEPVTVTAILRSTCPRPVRGRLCFTDCHQSVDIDPATPGLQTCLPVTLRPRGLTSVPLRLPPCAAGVHSFSATFEPDSPGGDSLAGNNTAEAITVVRGRTRVLYVDHEAADRGKPLLDALRAGGLSIGDEDHVDADRFPTSAADLQSYDAVVLADVPRGPGGLGIEQERALVQYVRDLGGGLVVLGGPDALGAGQWQGSELEQILPLTAEPQARKLVPPGALVLVLDHSGSMADPLAPGVSKLQVATESAVLATQAATAKDYVGVVAFDTSPNWVVPLAPNDRPQQTADRIRHIGAGGGTSIYPALKQACDDLSKLDPEKIRVRHILLMTDGFSEPGDFDKILGRLTESHITLSTVAVGRDADRELLARLARRGGGQVYVANDPRQLTQAFVREARTLRRPLIHEPLGGIPLAVDSAAAADFLHSAADWPLPRLGGIVLAGTRPRSSAQVVIRSDTAERDPVLAHWQVGLGHAAVFTGDATPRWAKEWVGSPVFARFWSEVIRSTARATDTAGFDAQMVRDGDRTRLIVEASNSRGPRSFLSFAGKLAGPDARRAAADIRLEQTGPGRYETLLDTPLSGAYFAALRYSSPAGDHGTLIAGTLVPFAPELRDLASNEALLRHIATDTGGRVLPGFDAAGSLFSREGLRPSVTSQPIRDVLILTLLGVALMDVAVRRVAWDWVHVKQLLATAAARAHGFLTLGTVQSAAAIGALRKVKTEATEQQCRKRTADVAPPVPPRPAYYRPHPTVRYDAPIIARCDPPPIASVPPPLHATPGQLAGNLLEAKRRAKDVIRQKELGQ